MWMEVIGMGMGMGMGMVILVIAFGEGLTKVMLRYQARGERGGPEAGKASPDRCPEPTPRRRHAQGQASRGGGAVC